MGEEFAPMVSLTEHLACRPYSTDIFAVKSMYAFVLTTAPSYQEAAGHDMISIQYSPKNGLFGVSYSTWVSPTRNPTHRTATSRSCEYSEVVDIIDRYVLPLFLVRRADLVEFTESRNAP
jgi:hypothetical protein